MDFKKVKFFSYGVLLSVFLLIVGIVGVKYIGDYYINTLTGDLVVDAYQKIKIIRWSIIVLFSVTLFISYISLLIQTCRIDESNESHFYIVMSMLSVIPLCALTLIVRTSHLQVMERNKKIKMLATSLENEIGEEKDLENNESLFYDSPVKENNEILKEENNLVENFDYDSNDALTYENDSFDKMEKTKFNKKKYLSLKGTIYSKEKKEGKKKISSSKWKELENLVEQLESFEIDEETFYLKKEELLSK